MTRSTGFKIAAGSGLAVLLVLVAGIVVLVYGASTACGCAVPDRDDRAIETAQQYVAVVAEDPEAMLAEGATAPDADRVAELAELDAADTVWTVLVTERPEGGDGRSPADRLIAGMTPQGEVTGLVVHTETDSQQGTVDPAVQVELDDDPAVTARSGEYPIFGDLNVGIPADGRLDPALVSLTDGRLRLSVTGSGGAWAYVGTEPLQQDRYRLLRGVHLEDGWRVQAQWFSPSDPVNPAD